MNLYGRRLRELGILAFLLVSVTSAREPAGEDSGPDHGAFHALLEKYVTPSGVRYRAWSENEADRAELRKYLDRMSHARPSEMARHDALAFWINLYNAVTLNLVLENHPVESIKDVGGFLSSPWKKKLITVEGVELTLNEIENDIIRPRFQEPRIHFALNCAAKSCPPLRAQAYEGARIEEQLEEQTKAFLANRTENRVDERGRLELSKIFDWYEKDFTDAAGSVVDWVRPYFPALAGREEKISVHHREYDWALNEARQ